jgi:hypothetical protein
VGDRHTHPAGPPRWRVTLARRRRDRALHPNTHRGCMMKPNDEVSVCGLIVVISIALASLPRSLHAQPSPPGDIVRRSLPSDTTIDGIPCARSGRAPAEFHRNGRLAGCALSREHQVGVHRFAAGTWLDFNAEAVLWGAWLSKDTSLDGHLCRGEGYKKWSVRFHSNGTLSGCYLAADTVIAGVPCMRGTFLREVRGGGKTALQLFADGKFRRCQAARDTVVDGHMIRKWQVVERDSAGSIHVHEK